MHLSIVFCLISEGIMVIILEFSQMLHWGFFFNILWIDKFNSFQLYRTPLLSVSSRKMINTLWVNLHLVFF